MRISLTLRRLFVANTALAALACGAPAFGASITLNSSESITLGGNCGDYVVTGTAPNQLLTCNSAPPAAGAPSGCSLKASPTTVDGTLGGQITLTANCTVTAADKWDWTGPPSLPAAQTVGPTGIQAFPLPVSDIGQTFYATPSLAGVAGTTVSTTVFATPVNPPPGGAISCAGYAKTTVIDAPIPANGQPQVRYFSSSYGGLGSTTALIVRFQAPANDPYFRILMKTASGAQDTPKTVALSATACTFNVPSKENLYAAARSSSATVSMSATPGATPGATYNGLVGGQTYYLNISNKIGSTNMCSGTCDVLITTENVSP